MNAHVHGTASEWFSVGITLHELLTGRRPFEANRLQAFRHRTQFPEADADYHPALLFDSADPGPHVFGRAPQTQYTGSRVSSGSGTDALWPDFLNQCDFLSQGCKDFVRALLIPDVSLQTLALASSFPASFYPHHCSNSRATAWAAPTAHPVGYRPCASTRGCADATGTLRSASFPPRRLRRHTHYGCLSSS